MRIFLISSKHCYDRLNPIVKELEMMGHIVTLPNCFDNPTEESNYKITKESHRLWKANKFKESISHIETADAVLVVNLPIVNRPDRYIGGATMLEMYEAFRQNKQVFVYDELPDCLYTDELNGLITCIIHKNLHLIQ